MWKKKLLGLSLILSILAISVIFVSYKWVYSEGSRSGRLVKLSKKGHLFKEWEGLLDLGSGDQLTWSFSVRGGQVGEELLKQIGEQVTVDYREHLFSIIYSTKYDVYNWRIKGVNPSKICPFLYLLRGHQQTLEKAAELIKGQRKDLTENVESCLLRLERRP